MVTHIVFWNFSDKSKAEENAAIMKEKLEGLVGVVPGLLSATVNRGFKGFDIALLSTLQDKQALQVYQNHPAHLKVKEFVHTVVNERACCDFENQ